MAEQIITKIVTDDFTDEELIGLVASYEQSIYASLEEAGITKEMLAEVRAQFNATLTTIFNAQLTSANIEDAFAAVHAIVDFYEAVVFAMLGAPDAAGNYGIIDMYVAYLTLFMGSSAEPEVDIVVPA
jgi:hypothetical protein